jgi:hypothetical protein
MSGLKDRHWRVRLGLGTVAVLILGVVGVAVAKSNVPQGKTPQKAIGRGVDVSLAPRLYQFIGQGQIQGGSGNTLLIGDVPIVLNNQTQLVGSVQPGQFVSLSGYILANQSWLADRIEPVSDSNPYFIFAGPLESSSESGWKVGGISVRVDKNTVIDSSLKPSDMALVTFSVQADGNWLASKIESLQNNPDVLPTSIPTATPTPAPTATVVATTVPIKPELQPVSPGKLKPEGHGKGKGKDGGKGKGKGGGKGKGKGGGKGRGRGGD